MRPGGLLDGFDISNREGTRLGQRQSPSGAHSHWWTFDVDKPPKYWLWPRFHAIRLIQMADWLGVMLHMSQRPW